MDSIKCKICEKEFKSLIGLSKHLSPIHQISSNEYYDKYLKKEKEGICQCDNCLNKTNFISLINGYTKYCSNKCVTIQTPKNLKYIKCKICGKSFKGLAGLGLHLSNSKIKNHPSFKEYKSQYFKKENLPIECKICLRKFKNLKALGHHLSISHNIKSKNYYDKFLRKEKEGICYLKNCNNETSFMGLNKGYLSYCSHKHYCICPELNKKRSENNIKSWDNPNSGHNSKNCRKKISNAIQKRWDNPNNFLNSKKLKEIRSKYMKEIWADPNGVFNTPEHRKIRSNFMKELWKDPNCIWRSKEWLEKVIPKRRMYMLNGGAAYISSFIKNPSKPQVELFELVKTIYPKTILNFPCLNFSIDIVIPEINIAIEYDGSYWHQNKDYDNKRQKLIENQGWKFLRYVDYIPQIEELEKDIHNLLKCKEIN